MIIRGTSHFVSYTAACYYYRPYGFDHRDVQRKLRTGEIHLRPPKLKAGESLMLVDNGQRYAIKDSNP